MCNTKFTLDKTKKKIGNNMQTSKKDKLKDRVKVEKMFLNYLHNTLQVSKDTIEKMVEDAIDKKVDKLFRQKEDIILKFIDSRLRCGGISSTIINCIKGELKKILADNLKIDISLNYNGEKQ